MAIQDDSGTHVTLAGQEDTSDLQELPRGSNLGRYVIIEPIGSGGMGTVYRAYDPQLNRGVALKILSVKHANLQTAEKAKARLIREAQALAQLSHPNVVAVHDAGIFEDDVFIAMELVEGKTLNNWLKEEKRSVKQILEVMIAAGRGLSAAHRADLVHRDFKPGNVIVGDDGRVRVLDFGLARAASQQGLNEDNPTESEAVLDTADARNQGSSEPFDFKEISSDSSANLLQSPLTHVGGILGTPMYMAPEQHLGRNTDERTDQFGFCVVLYEALYRKRPFAARSLGKLKSEVIQQEVLVPPTDTDIPVWLWHIVRRGLKANPEERYPTIDLLLEDLDQDPEEETRLLRAQWKRKLLMIGFVLLAIVLPIAIWYGLRYGTVLQCKESVESESTRVWSAESGQEIEISFLMTKASFAGGSWKRVKSMFDEYIADWAGKQSELCESTWFGVQSGEFLSLKKRCFAKRLVEFQKMVQIFSRADIKVVEKAVQAASNLSSLARCLDEDALISKLDLPHEKIVSQVESLRERLLTVSVLTTTGKYKEGSLLAQAVLSQAEKLGYQPLLAEALYWTGRLCMKLGKYAVAEEKLKRAYWEAVQSNHLEAMALASIRLILAVGYRLGRADEGLSWGRSARTAIMLIRSPPDLLGVFYDQMGSVYFAQGKEQKALDYYRRSLKLNEKTNGKEHVNVAVLLNNIGVVFWRRKDYDQALTYYQRALELYQKVLGLSHPKVAANLNNIGLALLKKGEFDKANKYLLRAKVIWEDALGKEHPLVAWPLSGLGEVYLQTRKTKEAIATFERVVEICKKAICHPEPEGMTSFGLARSIWVMKKNRMRALSLAQKAREIYSKASQYQREIDAIDTWIQKNLR